MSDIKQNYNINDIVDFLENKSFEKFEFIRNSAYIYTNSYEIIIETLNCEISDENISLAIKVLKHLDECISKAYKWLEHFSLKNDKWYPDALDKGFEINGIYIGSYEYGGVRRPKTDGFTLSFSTKNYYPCEFTIKFHKNMHPFAVEECVM